MTMMLGPGLLEGPMGDAVYVHSIAATLYQNYYVNGSTLPRAPQADVPLPDRVAGDFLVAFALSPGGDVIDMNGNWPNELDGVILHNSHRVWHRIATGDTNDKFTVPQTSGNSFDRLRVRSVQIICIRANGGEAWDYHNDGEVTSSVAEPRSGARTRPYGGIVTGVGTDWMEENPTGDYVTNEFVGMTAVNHTDGSSGTVTSNTGVRIDAVLSGGSDNTWTIGDEYYINERQVNVLYLGVMEASEAQAAAASSDTPYGVTGVPTGCTMIGDFGMDWAVTGNQGYSLGAWYYEYCPVATTLSAESLTYHPDNLSPKAWDPESNWWAIYAPE